MDLFSELRVLDLFISCVSYRVWAIFQYDLKLVQVRHVLSVMLQVLRVKGLLRYCAKLESDKKKDKLVANTLIVFRDTFRIRLSPEIRL